jgi:hypothetical protein
LNISSFKLQTNLARVRVVSSHFSFFPLTRKNKFKQERAYREKASTHAQKKFVYMQKGVLIVGLPLHSKEGCSVGWLAYPFGSPSPFRSTKN